MKRLFSEVQKRKAFNSQLNLLRQDLKDCLLLLENKRYRSAYIFLFDSLERVFDLFFIQKEKNQLEELKEKNLSSNIFHQKLIEDLEVFIMKGGVECTKTLF
jgi:ribosomal protein L22